MKKNSKQKLLSVIQTKVLVVCCLFLLGGSNLFAQKMEITGTVTDESGETLVGVSVQITQKNLGVITNIDGKYTIAAEKGDVLEFYYVGMTPKKITVGTEKIINATLTEDSKLLGEVVVIGYGTAKKRDLTGSIVSIKGSEVSDKPSSNPLASLQGKVAGVQIVNTGRAGQDPEIRMRGTNSINGYTPLYVVDGLLTNNINHLNSSDIESMEILKDASSLAIFGVRAANGVIIITTKKAKAGQTLVSFNSSVGWKEVNDRMSMTNAAQFKELYNEQRANMKAAPFDYTNWGYDTDWQDEIFQTGFMSNNNLSITGAGEKSKFYMGIGYQEEEGNIKSEKYSRLTFNLSSEYSVTKDLRFGFQVNGSKSVFPDGKGVGTAIKAAPIARVHEETTGLLYTMPDFQRAQVWNPMIDIEYRGDHTLGQNYRGNGNIYGDFDFLKHFNFKATFSMNINANQSRSYSPLIYVYNPDLNGDDKKERLTDSESISQGKTIGLSTQSDYVLTYTNKFGLHNLTAMAGMSTNYDETSSINAGRSQQYQNIIFHIPNDNTDKWWISILDNTAMTNGGSQNARFTMSYFARALYNYNNKYLFNASYRRDGSSVFSGVDNIWDNFYSFGGGWVVSEEDFMKSQEIISYLKLKSSWGVLGSQNTGGGNYPSYPGLTNSGSAVFGDNIVPGYSYQYNVQNLGWEKTESFDAGFEINLLNNRIRLEPVYYNKITNDLIVSLPSRTGAVNSLENLGSIRNKGLELAGSWSDQIGSSGFKYSLGGNFTTIDNEVITLGRDDKDALYNGPSRTIAGSPIAYFYGYKVAGVYQNYQDIKLSPSNSLATVEPGDLKFADINGDGKINADDRTMIGNPTPDFTYGFNIDLSYKNFDLSADFMGVYGNEIYRNWDDPTYARLNFLTEKMNRWHGEGTSNWEPIINPRAINLMTSNYFIEDGSFFRIRNIQLGYNFDAQLLKKAHIKTARIYANVQNLKTWHKNTGYVPEIGGSALQFGVDGGTYPMPAIYTLGLNVTF